MPTSLHSLIKKAQFDFEVWHAQEPKVTELTALVEKLIPILAPELKNYTNFTIKKINDFTTSDEYVELGIVAASSNDPSTAYDIEETLFIPSNIVLAPTLDQALKIAKIAQLENIKSNLNRAIVNYEKALQEQRLKIAQIDEELASLR